MNIMEKKRKFLKVSYIYPKTKGYTMTTLTDIIELLEKSIREENWEISSEVLSLLYVYKENSENNDGLFDNFDENDEW